MIKTVKPSTKKFVFTLFAAVLFQLCAVYIIIQLNKTLALYPLPLKAFFKIAFQWLQLLVPFIFMKLLHEKVTDYGFSKDKIAVQIFTGIIIGLVLTFIFTVMPILFGLKEQIGSSTHTKPEQFCYFFVYTIAGVGFVEEFFSRGFIYKKLMDIKQSKWFAIIASSVIFGLLHIFTGNTVQIFVSAFIGFIFCVCRDKIKSCTTLSLIFAHGIHNALINLFVVIL